MYGRNYGNNNQNSLDEIITGDKTFTGLTDFSDGEIVLPIQTPVNAVAASESMTVVARPASYVKNIFASLTTALVGDNNDIKFTSKTLGTGGNAIEIKYVDPGTEGALAIGVVGTVITITLANSAVPAITTIASEIKTLIEATPAAHALVGITYPVGNDGSGIVTALAQTPLSGGITEVRNYRTVGAKNYTFATTTTGDNPTADYPTDVRVDSAAGEADMTVIAEALRTAVDTDPLWNVTRLGATVYIKALVRGEGAVEDGTGNFAPFENHCATPANVTPLGTTTLMSGGVNGTPGYQGQKMTDGKNEYICSTDDYTVTNNYWLTSKESITVMAGAFLDGTVPPKAYALYSNKIVGREFGGVAGAIAQDVYFNVAYPKNVKATDFVRFRYRGLTADVAAMAIGKTLVFSLAGNCINNGELTTKALGTAVINRYTATEELATNEHFCTDWSDKITIANLLGGCSGLFQFARVVTDGNNYVKPIVVTSVEIEMVV